MTESQDIAVNGDSSSDVVQGTALVETDDGRVVLAPRSTGDLHRLAVGLSKSALIPKALRGRPADIMVVALEALEKHIPLMTGLRQIAVINGKPFLEAQLLHALALRSPQCRYVRLVESTDEKATWETKRANDPAPVTLSYTMADAARAASDRKDTYKSHPAAMLRARALAALLRVVYPDVAGGIYVPEEADVVIDVAPEPVAQPAAEDAIDVTGDDPTLSQWAAEAAAI